MNEIKNPKISNRLKKCADLVSCGSKIADIGTDHAYIPIYLMLQRKISHAIACDIGEGPLKNAEKNIKSYGFEKDIETRLSDGFLNIKENEADEIIIAGMGGNMISNILRDCPWENKHTKRFILNPMKYEEKLHEFLFSNGYEIQNEIAVKCSGKSYLIIDARFTGKIYTPLAHELYIGKLEKNLDEHAFELIKKQIKNIENHRIGAHAECNFKKERYFDEIHTYLSNILKRRNSRG